MSVENDIREAFRARAASVRPSKRAWSRIVRRLDVEAASTREGEAVASVRHADIINLSADPESTEPEAATERQRDRRFETAEDWMAASGPTESGAPIRVLLVGDQPVWRDGVRAALDRLGTAVTVGEAGDRDDALGLVRETMPDVVLMALPGLDGILATFFIVETSQYVRVLAVSDSASESDVLEAIKFGAHGCIQKSATSAEIGDAVTRVAGGEPVVAPSLASLVLSRQVTAAHGVPALTPRENEVLTLIAKGSPYRDIARKLFIKPKTVTNHVQNILTKLQLGGRYALEHEIEKEIDGRSD